MSELILTEEEKKTAWIDAPDKLVADITRSWMVKMKEIESEKSASAECIYAVCNTLGAIRAAVETNADTLTITTEGVSFADKKYGDWKVTVERISS